MNGWSKKLDSPFSEGMQVNYTHTTTGSAPKMHYSDIWGPYMVKF